jgi:hypothetical protein
MSSGEAGLIKPRGRHAPAELSLRVVEGGRGIPILACVCLIAAAVAGTLAAKRPSDARKAF